MNIFNKGSNPPSQVNYYTDWRSSKGPENDSGKQVFEDPYSTLKSQSLFRSRPIPCQDMLRPGNGTVLALRQDVVLFILAGRIITRSFGAWVVNLHTYPTNLRRNPNRRLTQSSPCSRSAWSSLESPSASPSSQPSSLAMPFPLWSPPIHRTSHWGPRFCDLGTVSWKLHGWCQPTEVRTHPWQVFLRSQVSIIVPAAFGTDVLPGHHAHLSGSATSRTSDQCPVENLLAWEIKQFQLSRGESSAIHQMAFESSGLLASGIEHREDQRAMIQSAPAFGLVMASIKPRNPPNDSNGLMASSP